MKFTFAILEYPDNPVECVENVLNEGFGEVLFYCEQCKEWFNYVPDFGEYTDNPVIYKTCGNCNEIFVLLKETFKIINDDSITTPPLFEQFENECYTESDPGDAKKCYFTMEPALIKKITCDILEVYYNYCKPDTYSLENIKEFYSTTYISLNRHEWSEWHDEDKHERLFELAYFSVNNYNLLEPDIPFVFDWENMFHKYLLCVDLAGNEFVVDMYMD